MKLNNAKRMLHRFPCLSPIIDQHREKMPRAQWIRNRLQYIAIRRISSLSKNIGAALFGALASDGIARDAEMPFRYMVEVNYFYHFEGEEKFSRRFDHPCHMPYNRQQTTGWSQRRVGASVLLDARRYFRHHPPTDAKNRPYILDAVLLSDIRFFSQHDTACSFELHLSP